MACVKTRKSTAKATVCFAFPLTQTRKVRAISFIGKKPTKSRTHGTTFASRTITPCFGCTGSRDQRRGSLPGARGKNCCWWKASPAAANARKLAGGTPSEMRHHRPERKRRRPCWRKRLRRSGILLWRGQRGLVRVLHRAGGKRCVGQAG